MAKKLGIDLIFELLLVVVGGSLIAVVLRQIIIDCVELGIAMCLASLTLTNGVLVTIGFILVAIGIWLQRRF